MRILVTGGLGYIGSHTVVELLQAGFDVTIVDDLSHSRVEVLDRIHTITGKSPDFFIADIRNPDALQVAFSHAPVHAVIHFAALKVVAESFEKPELYHSVNVTGVQTLCDVMQQNGVHRLVFSSSAAVYGSGHNEPLTEESLCEPMSPYGTTKREAELFLQGWIEKNNTWSVVMLRYFNPIGAHESGLIGDAPKEATGIAPVIMEVIAGVRPHVVLNGDDYPTPDGTPIRDFIHVVDVARAHLVALEYTREHKGCSVFNIGTGSGYSVKELLMAFHKASGKDIPVLIGKRRVGDIVRAIADVKKIRSLGWSPVYTLDEMASSSVRWALHSDSE